MNYLGIEAEIKNVSALDPGFYPMGRFNEEFRKTARKPIGIALERAGGSDRKVSAVIDGDVTALAGAMSLGGSNVLGIAMGTSEAGGKPPERTVKRHA